ncbi:MAG TPA: STAS domain-containing protein [Acidimicrobiales bacterium]|nr:STAS domain-containing protein [Acidimicrobiales bacterium]
MAVEWVGVEGGRFVAVEVGEDGRLVTIIVNGDLDDPALGSALRQAVIQAVAPGPLVVRIDLRQVGFMGGMGLSVLMMARRRLAAEGIRLVLVGPGQPVGRVLALTKVEGYFEIEHAV